jgi:acyl-coenzyme A thioesterase PaaI-like protein
MLSDKEKYKNHLGTIHASAQFSLAEATSGYFLLKEFQEIKNIIPVVRKVEVKYKKPAQGKLFSKAELKENEEEIIKELFDKQRVLITVKVGILDSKSNITMVADFEWFIALNKEYE